MERITHLYNQRQLLALQDFSVIDDSVKFNISTLSHIRGLEYGITRVNDYGERRIMLGIPVSLEKLRPNPGGGDHLSASILAVYYIDGETGNMQCVTVDCRVPKLIQDCGSWKVEGD